MTKRTASKYAFAFTVWFLILCEFFTSPVAYGLKNSQIAGHRILKTYDEKSGGGLNYPRTIFQDSSGLFWIGISDGVRIYDEKRDQWRSLTKQTGLLANYNIGMIGQSKDNKLWFAPYEGDGRLEADVSCFDGERWDTTEREYKKANLRRGVTTMFSGRDGRLWFALGYELLFYDGKRWSPAIKLSEVIEDSDPPLPPSKWYLRDGAFTSLAGLQDSEGYIWLGTYKGIVRFNESKHEWKIQRTPTPSVVRHIYEDRKGRIWFADNGSYVFVHDKGKDSWKLYNLLDHLPANSDQVDSSSSNSTYVHIKSIYQDRAGCMMFATSLGLLTFIESENKWELFTSENSGLPSSIISTIMEDRTGRIWIGTDKGIVVLEQ